MIELQTIPLYLQVAVVQFRPFLTQKLVLL